MGGEQAAGVLFTVKQEQLRKEDKPLMSEDEERAFKQPTLDLYEHEGSPYYSTARLWDDGILDPLETRRVLGLSIAMACSSLWHRHATAFSACEVFLPSPAGRGLG
jgi:acetyl-CoA carboxylase carboxyltransferase component